MFTGPIFIALNNRLMAPARDRRRRNCNFVYTRTYLYILVIYNFLKVGIIFTYL